MRLLIITNTSKSKVTKDNGVYKLEKIPVTVDDSVMNGTHYDEYQNKKGMRSFVGMPMTLTHPENKDGYNVSALSPDGIDYYAGGKITDAYNKDGVWYFDAEIKEKKMRSNDDNMGDYFADRLDSGLPIGVSTGLMYERNEISGENKKGEKYSSKAINIQGDHLAMLHESEKPAGGDATVMRFNGEDFEVCNFDDFAANSVVESGQEDKTESIINRALTAFAKRIGISYNSQEFDNPNEDYAMRKTIEAELQAAGIEVNGLDDNALLEAYNKLNAPKEPEQKPQTNSEETPAWAKDLITEVNSLKTQFEANANKELDALVSQVVELKINGIDEEVAKTMGVNALKGLLAANGQEFVADGYGGPQSGRSAATNKKDDEFDKIDLNKGLEG